MQIDNEALQAMNWKKVDRFSPKCF